MKKLSARGLKWLKAAHLICAIAWMGTAMGFLLELLVAWPANQAEARIYTNIMRLLDDDVLVAGAYGILLTGLVYGIWSNWGFFKYRWVAIKWLLTIFMVLLGTFGMGPLVEQNCLLAAQDGAYGRIAENLDKLKWYAILQNLLLLSVIWLSVFKPSGRRKT